MAVQRPTGDMLEMLEKQAKDLRKIKRRLGIDAQARADIDSLLTAENWNRPTLLNGWTNYGTPYEEAGYKKLANGLVVIVGLVRDGTYSDVFTLPTGYRPAKPLIFRVQSQGGGNRVDVKEDGDVLASASGGDLGSWLSLSGIVFYADGS